jgi:transposase-like protein
MPRAYSTDLRERVLAACEAGEGSQAEVARRFQGLRPRVWCRRPRAEPSA